MLKRREIAQPAQITFTSDFHELVTGDLRPGHSVILSYDPKRIVPKSEPYIFGDPARPIVAFVQFRDDEPPMNAVLMSPGGIIKEPDEDITGQGSMLKARFVVPDNADRMSVWFSYNSASKAIFHDSDYGKNFNFSFLCRDINLLSATVVNESQTRSATFAISLAATKCSAAVSVRLHVVGDRETKGGEVKLMNTGNADEQGRPIWSVADVAVPYGCVVRFKVYYWIGGRRFKDDNTGHYYLAPQPESEYIPPPPPELARAALAWK